MSIPVLICCQHVQSPHYVYFLQSFAPYCLLVNAHGRRSMPLYQALCMHTELRGGMQMKTCIPAEAEAWQSHNMLDG